MTPEQQTRVLNRSNILTMVPVSITSTQKSTRSEPPQYTIQVGAYKTEANAKQVVNNLLEKGYRAHVNPDLKDGAPLFKVHIDEFRDKNEARKLAEKLTTKENLSNFVTTSINWISKLDFFKRELNEFTQLRLPVHKKLPSKSKNRSASSLLL